MKNVLFISLFSILSISLSAQTNAEVVGKTITDSIMIKNGAVTGHILQSENGMGLGKWVHADSVRDNLGNHLATMDLNMDTNSIVNVAKLNFFQGQTIDPSDTTRLKFNSSIDLQCDTLLNVDQITFCAGGGPSGTTLTEFPPIIAPTEMVLANGGPGVALGIGGPANAGPIPGPIPPPAPVSPLVLAGVVPPAFPLFFSFGVYGEAWAFDWWATSDARFKRDIEHFEGALSKINQMKGVTYEMNQNDFPDRNFQPGVNYGFLAQDLLPVAPELVRMNSEGYYLVNYDGIIPILAEGIKELDEKVILENQTLQDEITSLKAENNQLEDRLEKLEELVMNNRQLKKQKKRNRK